MTARMHASRFLRDSHGFIIAQRVEIDPDPDAPPMVGNIVTVESALGVPDPRPLPRRTSATRTAAQLAAETTIPVDVDLAHPDRGPAPPGFVGSLRHCFASRVGRR
jgi:hypothetical protein